MTATTNRPSPESEQEAIKQKCFDRLDDFAQLQGINSLTDETVNYKDALRSLLADYRGGLERRGLTVAGVLENQLDEGSFAAS
jgi:hypothetical protein